jgi:ATP phosphoribosyltransferase regulatory subunit
VTVGHVQFLGGVAERLGLSPDETVEMRHLVDRRQAEALDNFLAPHAPRAEREDFCRLITLGGRRDVLDLARTLVGNPRSIAAIDQLEGIFDTLDAVGLSSRVDVDLGDVAALDYYTGMTFKVYAPGWGLALGGGGRYDALLARFGRDEAAVGFSLSLDWLAGALAARGLDAARKRPSAPERLDAGADLRRLFARAISLRRAGRSVEIRPGCGQPGGGPSDGGPPDGEETP